MPLTKWFVATDNNRAHKPFVLDLERSVDIGVRIMFSYPRKMIHQNVTTVHERCTIRHLRALCLRIAGSYVSGTNYEIDSTLSNQLRFD